ncbi:hypothetical protein BAE44_0007965 [Dichanthelium oligosanthes]|uniref:Uncharacterized protein n=1 Tax=Dichanthelium oligosanthes TaxID=888268 RepID=A0A1E5W0U3_9POAL|nr:hypothetical protein BAE44_0007965 [Dichanthelium oligosanthes]
MDAKIFDAVGAFFSSGENIPWCDRDVIAIQPNWGQALAPKKTVEGKIAKDGVIGIGIATTALGLLVGIAAAVARKN